MGLFPSEPEFFVLPRAMIHRICRSLIFFGLSAGLQGGVAAAQTATRTAEQPAVLLRLNEGILSFANGSRGDARAAFDDVLRSDPENVTALYYRALIDLNEAISPSGTEPEGLTASELFKRARDRLARIEQISQLSDRPIEGGLLLGISQLASDDAQKNVQRDPSAKPEPSDTALKLAQDARDTLLDYTKNAGADDRLGYFFLAVAYYRIMFEAELREDSWTMRENVGPARDALEKSWQLAQAAAREGRPKALDESGLEQFRITVEYYRGLISIRTRDYATAMASFADVRDSEQADTNVRGFAGKLYDKIKEKKTAARPALQIPVPAPLGPLEFSGEISIGGLYDDNVILLGENTQLPRGIPDERDYAGTIDAGFNIKRYFAADELPFGESLTLGIGGQTGHAWHPSIREFDLNTYLGRVFVNWQPFADFYLGVQYEYSYTFLGHEPFISSNRLTPVATYIWRRPGGGSESEIGQTDLYYVLDYRDYRDEVFDARLNRDGDYHAIGLRQKLNFVQSNELWPAWHESDTGPRKEYFADRWFYAYLGYEFRDERTDGKEFDLNGNSLLAGIEFPLPWRLSLGLDTEFAWDDYNNRSLFDFRGNARRDFIQRYDFGLSYVIVAPGEVESMQSLDVKLRAGVGLTFQDSNTWDRLHQRVYEYNRAVYSLTLAIGF